jgi:hypothetical protein
MARIIFTAEEHGERLVDNFDRRMEELRRFGGFVDRDANPPDPSSSDVPSGVFDPIKDCFKNARTNFGKIAENQGIDVKGEEALEKLKKKIAEVWGELTGLEEEPFGNADEMSEYDIKIGGRRVQPGLWSRLHCLFDEVGKGKGQILIQSGFRPFGLTAGEGDLYDPNGEKDSRLACYAHWNGWAIDMETVEWRKDNGLTIKRMDELAAEKADLWRPNKSGDACHWSRLGYGW